MAVFHDLVFEVHRKPKENAERRCRSSAYDIMPSTWMVHEVKSESVAMDEKAGHWKVTVTMVDYKT